MNTRRSRLATALAACSAAIMLTACSEGDATDPPPATPEPQAQPAAESGGRLTNRDLYAKQMNDAGKGLTPEDEAAALQAFLRVWSKHKPVYKSKFMGVRTFQNPLDAWVVQEVIVEVTPDVIVEAGTANGGSSLLWAMLLREVNPDGRIITIDIEDRRESRAKQHALAKSYVDFLHGSSTDPQIVGEVRRRVAGKRVLVLLDSLHTREHIAAELAAYAPLVAVGSYVIVQDTPLGGVVAILEFVAANDHFSIDRSRERFVLTSSQFGYLKRIR